MGAAAINDASGASSDPSDNPPRCLPRMARQCTARRGMAVGAAWRAAPSGQWSCGVAEESRSSGKPRHGRLRLSREEAPPPAKQLGPNERATGAIGAGGERWTAGDRRGHVQGNGHGTGRLAWRKHALERPM